MASASKRKFYLDRAGQLMLSADDRTAYADIYCGIDDRGRCPRCGEALDRYESTVVQHVRTCTNDLAEDYPGQYITGPEGRGK